MGKQLPPSWVIPEWTAPENIRCISTSREGGVSSPPYASFNVGTRVGDDPRAVAVNRARLAKWLSLPAEPAWLRQVHSNTVVEASEVRGHIEADATIATSANLVCVVTTADCLPVLLCDRKGTCVAAVHVGWRGLVAGVLERAVEALRRPPEQIMAWLGPAIGPHRFEVSDEVRTAFLHQDAVNESAFTAAPRGRWLGDICQLACNRLWSKGVSQIFGGGLCTYTDAARFFSYRRDGVTGRMASLIWLE